MAALATTLGLATPVTASPLDSHLRCLSGGCEDLVAYAVERSPMIGSLVNELERSDVVVYLHLPGALTVNEPASRLLFVSAAGGRRYLVVQIDPWRTSYPDRVALLGHELYHALEVARARQVMDIDAFKRLYRQIGHEYGAGGARFETDEAKSAEREVRRDLTGSRAEAMARDRERALSPSLLDGRG
jgi:hypothetical protein